MLLWKIVNYTIVDLLSREQRKRAKPHKRSSSLEEFDRGKKAFIYIYIYLLYVWDWMCMLSHCKKNITISLFLFYERVREKYNSACSQVLTRWRESLSFRRKMIPDHPPRPPTSTIFLFFFTTFLLLFFSFTSFHSTLWVLLISRYARGEAW